MELIKENVSDFNNSMFYICGPEGMKNKTKLILKKLKVSKNNIKIEDFFW